MKITNLYPRSQDLSIEVDLFLEEWYDSNSFVIVNTSGSTGTPKQIKIEKLKMINSAKMTGDFLGFKKGMRALLTLSPKYIAGKMMIVRALVWELELVLGLNRSLPVDELKISVDFSAMIPTQVGELLKHEFEFEKLGKLIIGGAPINENVKEQLVLKSNEIYATFGMTETISHIALARIKTGDLIYRSLPDITISQNNDDCLVINAPKLLEQEIVTNDIVNIISENEFIWKGRKDFVINSGGVKVLVEELELKLSTRIIDDFFIASEKDEKFGEVVVLYVESNIENYPLLNFDDLEAYEKPRKIIFRSKFYRTKTGKLNRKATIEKGA